MILALVEVEKNIKNVVATRRVPLRGMKAKVEYHGASVQELNLASKKSRWLDEFLPAGPSCTSGYETEEEYHVLIGPTPSGLPARELEKNSSKRYF